MTRRPLEVRIRARNPEVLLRLRLVPPNVRLVILSLPQASQTRFENSQSTSLPPFKQSCKRQSNSSMESSSDRLRNLNHPSAQIAQQGQIAGGHDLTVKVKHAA